MDACTYMSDCDFYNDKLDVMPMTTEFIKMMYCHKESEACAKFHNLSYKETNKASSDPADPNFSKFDDF